jgi:release factor glutamine methyltransferase
MAPPDEPAAAFRAWREGSFPQLSRFEYDIVFSTKRGSEVSAAGICRRPRICVRLAGVTGVSRSEVAAVTRRLAAAGCVAASEEAEELALAASGDPDRLAALVERRVGGEPLAWVTGTVAFCGCTVAVDPGVYVPRWQSEPLAERAADLLPPEGRAIDLGTGSGAIACVLQRRHPDASVLGTESDPIAARCARRNGVTVVEGGLFSGVPRSWMGTVDVVVAVLPYVPTGDMAYLPRDVREFEPTSALDGGDDGLAVIRPAVMEARSWLRAGGHILFEIGGDQPDALLATLAQAQFDHVRVLVDGEGDPRGVEAVAVGHSPGTAGPTTG